MSATVPPKVVDPPFYDAPIVDHPSGQQHSQAWTEYHQSVADQLAATAQQIADMQAQLGTGVVDGSDAAAGKVGEFLSASGSGSLTSAVAADQVTLTLPAGDWDVAGSAVITPTTTTMAYAQAWLNTAANTVSDPGRATIQSQTAGTLAGTLGAINLVVGPRRFSVTASTAVHLGCQAQFPGGTAVSANAFIRARRMR